VAVENEIEKVPPLHIIGALSLTTKNIKLQVGEYCAGISLLTEYFLLGCRCAVLTGYFALGYPC
jgi:hypothetical protein